MQQYATGEDRISDELTKSDALAGAIRELTDGFPLTRMDQALEPILKSWSQKIGKKKGPIRRSPQSIQFSCSLPFCLRGMGTNLILFVGKDSDAVRVAINNVVKRAKATKMLGVLVGLTDSSAEYLQSSVDISSGRCLVLTGSELQALLSAENSNELLQRHILECVPYTRLIPFSTSDPAEGPVFFGRDNEVARLVHGNQDYALCGSGGMGKTSLLRQMQWVLRTSRDERHPRIVEVDLLGISDLREAAKRIALRITPNSEAQAVSVSSLEPFLRHQRFGDTRFHDGPIDLVLDEMDSVLSSDRRTTRAQLEPERLKQEMLQAAGDREKQAEVERRFQQRYPLMQILRHARTQGLIRLTVSGRTETKKLLADPENPFVVDEVRLGKNASRLKLMEVTSLNVSQSQDMLFKPLRDLGCCVNKDKRALLKTVGGVQWRAVPYCRPWA